MRAKIKTANIPYCFNENPMKSLDQALTPKKSHAEFPSHKNFSLLYSQNYAARRMQELSQIFRLFWTPKKIPYLNQATPQKNTCQNFPTKKKSFEHPCHFTFGVPPWCWRLPLLETFLYDLWYDNNVLHFLLNHTTNTQEWD